MGRKRPSLDFRMSPQNCHEQQIEIPSDEEDEANEDLSLGILAKAKRNKAIVLEIISSDEDERPARPVVRILDESHLQTDDNNDKYIDDHNNNKKDEEYTGVESSGDKKCLEKEKIDFEAWETDYVSAEITPGSVGEIKSRKKKKKRKKSNQTLNFSTPEVTVTGTKEVAENMIDDHNQNLNLSTSEVADTETKVVENSVMRKLLRGPRYFDPPEEQEQLCYHCGEPGHIAVDCTVERRKKPCYVCGNVGHGARGCLQATECYICKKVGHIAKNCTEQRSKGDKKGHNFSICLRCGDRGHDMASCQKGYNAEDIKQIQCYVCKSFGHLCCIDVMDNCTREDSCYNCGEKGHTGMGCAKERRRKGGEGPAKTCFKCGEEGHFARGCRRNANLDRWTPDVANLGDEWVQDDANFFGFRSVPRDFGKAPRWADMESDLGKAATPGDFGSRNGWKRKLEDLKGTPQRMNTWDSPVGNLDFGGYKMGSGSNDQCTTSKMSKSHSSFSPNGSHHSYGFHNKYNSYKSKKRDGWKRSR
ncbi:uncharacterized protein LOC131052831 isoform X2 [Cryptomeria japonica]|uniref:uncharacterized protein LOC131052831 isoform X2 n=1 Tax=Cryptomeria japonica TaxID=3369 RepID=UPI0027DA6E3E|nr:uncharacterized protein LOC131052831 isoform X2 [Cryptomeria japonica]